MSLRLLVDMNLSPEWIAEFARHGFSAGQNVLPEHMAPVVIAVLRQHEAVLVSGAIVVVNERKARVRVLPL